MIITDMTQKDIAKLTLPTATQDEEDTDDQKDIRVIVNIVKKVPQGGDIRNWRQSDGVEILVKSQPLNLTQLKNELYKYAEMKRDLTLDVKPSEVFVLIRCDKDIRWREVQWVMQQAADPDVRIYKIQFATAKRKEE
jgi:biopolymer transport protein ExbD